MNALSREIREAKVEPGTLLFWWLGQNGFVMKSSNLTAVIDPYLSTFAERVTKGTEAEHVRMSPPPMRPEDVDFADVVLCTHDHADHIDPDGIPVIAKASARVQFVVPAAARETLLKFGIKADRVETLKGDDSRAMDGMEVFGIPAKHERFDYHPQTGFPYLSYVMRLEGKSVFHAGDTIPYGGQVERVRKHRVDLALVPINGRDDFRHKLNFEGNFDCREAVTFCLGIGAKLTVPMHYDLFTLNTADVNEFRTMAEDRGLRCHVMAGVGAKMEVR